MVKVAGKVYYSLYDRLLNIKRLEIAFKKVKSSKGAGGIDNQSINDFESNLQENLTQLFKELKAKTYSPLPVKRVEINKEETGGKRKLGIPVIRDRIVQQALLNILQPIYEEDFHPSSYGYRPGRSCHQAISKSTMFIRKYNLKWIVDMDLSKCFDTLNHDLIIKSLRKRVTDSSILNLIRKFLECGVMDNGNYYETKEGSPQGGVISPLISNVYLNSFDHFMKDRNYRIVRYADDILILCKSERSAEKVLKTATYYLEKHLKLTVNQEKTHVTNSYKGVKFLGVIIHSQYTKIQEKKLKKLKMKVKKITRRNSPVNIEKVIKDLNPVIRGFINYFRVANCTKEMERLMGWIRRRLRAKQLKLWKNPRKLHRKLRQNGYKGEFDLIKMSSWRNAACQLSHWAMPNSFFKDLGLFDITTVKTGIIVPC